MDHLVQQLEDLKLENERLRKHLALSKHNTTSTAGESSGVDLVYSLLSLMGSTEPDQAAKTLLAMSTCRESCQAMRKAGCLTLLVNVLHSRDSSKLAKQRSTTALWNLVNSHTDELWKRKEARVLRLLEQIRCHNEWIFDSRDRDDGQFQSPFHPLATISQIMKLSFDESYRQALSSLGAVQAVCELLVISDDCLKMQRDCCISIINLTFGDPSNKVLVCQPQTLTCVIGLLQYDEMVLSAASVIRNLSWCADMYIKKALNQIGAVSHLLEVATKRSLREASLKTVLNALWNLSSWSENKKLICGDANYITFILSTLVVENLHIVETGGGILRNISSYIAENESLRQLVRPSFAVLLAHLKSNSHTVIANAVGCIWNFSAWNTSDQKLFVELGALPILRKIANSFTHKIILNPAHGAIRNLQQVEEFVVVRRDDWNETGEDEIIDFAKRYSDQNASTVSKDGEDEVIVYKTTEGTPGGHISVDGSLYNMDESPPSGKKSVQFSEMVTPMVFSRTSSPDYLSENELASPRSEVFSEYSTGVSALATPAVVDSPSKGVSGNSTPLKQTPTNDVTNDDCVAANGFFETSAWPTMNEEDEAYLRADEAAVASQRSKPVLSVVQQQQTTCLDYDTRSETSERPINFGACEDDTMQNAFEVNSVQSGFSAITNDTNNSSNLSAMFFGKRFKVSTPLNASFKVALPSSPLQHRVVQMPPKPPSAPGSLKSQDWNEEAGGCRGPSIQHIVSGGQPTYQRFDEPLTSGGFSPPSIATSSDPEDEHLLEECIEIGANVAQRPAAAVDSRRQEDAMTQPEMVSTNKKDAELEECIQIGVDSITCLNKKTKKTRRSFFRISKKEKVSLKRESSPSPSRKRAAENPTASVKKNFSMKEKLASPSLRLFRRSLNKESSSKSSS